MIKRALLLSSPAYLHIKDEQLVISSKENGEDKTIPAEDIGFVMLENPQTTITLPAIQKLNDHNVALICCNKEHHPVAMLLNLDGHHLQGELFRNQISAGDPLKRQLWKKIIEAKIKNQAALLKKIGKPEGALPYLARDVKSDDKTNREGAAAREYWKILFGKGFYRDRYGKPPNHFLNYGYTILRAAVARALTGSGLLPTIGIHHHNRYNAYCLADDIMEPYRPFVDDAVFKIWNQSHEQIITKETKSLLLSTLYRDVKVGKVTRPLMLALSITTASLARCYSDGQKTIICPEF